MHGLGRHREGEHGLGRHREGEHGLGWHREGEHGLGRHREGDDGADDVIACCPFCGAESIASNARCHDCNLGLDSPVSHTLPTGQPEEELVYEFADWPVHLRVRLAAALGEREVLYRWEPGPDLVVLDRAGDMVDGMVDDVEAAELGPGEDEDYEEGGDDWSQEDGAEAAVDAVAQAAMADLFVAADRLMHDPSDPGPAEDLIVAAGIVDESAAPYGIEPPMWAKVRELAASVRSDLEHDTDEEAVALDAQALREALRRFV